MTTSGLVFTREVSKTSLPKLFETNFVYGYGSTAAAVMFIGEAPGEQEDLEKKPFVGKSGQLLTDHIKEYLGLTREQVYITNIVKQRPPGNRKPTLKEMLSHRQFLMEEIKCVQPELIVTLGKSALEGLCEKEISVITPYVNNEFKWKGYCIIPNYHPAALLHSNEYTKLFGEVFQHIKEKFDE